VFKLRSVNNIVIAPARTGRDKRRRIDVIKTDQMNKGIWSHFIPAVRILIMVVIKLIAPKIDDIPARCKLKIVKSTEAPACEILEDSGGYTVHPVPAPDSVRLPLSNRVREGGRSQNLRLFIRGKAISGAPIIRGISQFPKPPIIIGITIKKIIIKACAVTITLYTWSLPISLPG
jgi:hypothetical protein